MFASFALFAVYVSKTECPLEFSPRNTRKPRTKKGVSLVGFPRRESSPFPPENGMSAVIFTAKCAKIANKKGSVPSRFKAVQGRVQEEAYPPSREGTESREGRRGPRSCRSRCSRFMEFKGSVRCISDVKITAKYAKTAKSLYGLFLLVRAVRVVRGSYIFNRSVRCRLGVRKTECPQ